MNSVIFSFLCSLIHIMFLGVAYIVIFLLGAIVLAPLSPRKFPVYCHRLRKLALFLVALVVVGAFFDFLWTAFIWDRLYYSTDYCGLDFRPFMPITQSVIDAPWGLGRGYLIGITLFQLNLIWSAFALGTWVTTIAVYRWVRKKGEAPSPNLPRPVLST